MLRDRVHRIVPTRARRWLRRFSPKRDTRPVILMYHRVADVKSDPWGLAVSPANFRDQMRMLGEQHLCIPLADLVQALAGGRVPVGKVCITFDDGYSDNLLNAEPILEEFSIPATLFLTSGYLAGDRSFWWDALEQTLFQKARIPPTLELQLESTPLTLDLADDTEYRESVFAAHRHWRAWHPPPSRRHLAYYRLWQALHELPGLSREKVLDTIREWAGAPDAVNPDARPLSPQEIRRLASGHLLEIGGHSVTHPPLPVLDREGQWGEIVENKRRLEELIDRPLRHFAYPHGQLTEETVALVKQAGYQSACTGKVGAVDRSADPFRLPRVGAQDWNREEFARALRDRFAV